MNISIDKIFEELGRLHIQVMQQAELIVKLQNELDTNKIKEMPVDKISRS